MATALITTLRMLVDNELLHAMRPEEALVLKVLRFVVVLAFVLALSYMVYHG
ncbi:MAG: hypothetical protein ACPGD8_03850 [Flavobacteriales bacterium]